MEIFGFTITRTSKKKRDEETLAQFKDTVIQLDDSITKCTKLLRHVVQKPDLDMIQDLAQNQEEIESLIDIYCRNRFAKPASMFSLSQMIDGMRPIFNNIAKSARQVATLQLEVERAEEMTSFGFVMGFGPSMAKAFKKSTEDSYKQIMKNLSFSIKDYKLSLNAIKFTITYDSMRIATGVDIIKEYYQTKKNTVPRKGPVYALKYIQLSHDELNKIVPNKEEKEHEPERNRI
jgi:hypothetical protein